MSRLAGPPLSSTSLPTATLRPDPFSLSVYGETREEVTGLVESIRDHGILVPIVVAPSGDAWQVLSGHRRLACARLLDLAEVPCQVRSIEGDDDRKLAVLEYNRQRDKTFSQMMREADALETLRSAEARRRSVANLRRGTDDLDQADRPDRRDSDDRGGRTDSAIATAIGLGGKDLYRHARAIWRTAQGEDPRALASVAQIDAGSKTIHAAYKDLRRRDRFATGFRPTPYDVWAFKHDRAFGIPHPGSIPPAIVAHTLHYFTDPSALVIDPMAGGGTTLDVCLSMGRRCLAYDITPTRPDVQHHDIRRGFPPAALGSDLIFCDPPYHTMLSTRYPEGGVADLPLSGWVDFLEALCRDAFVALRNGGRMAILLANQTEKGLPAGHGYLDHAFHGYNALIAAGFLPERRISCPMDGAYLPQHVRQARLDGRMLGQVRDLIVARKPLS